jgi:hypothetical protein
MPVHIRFFGRDDRIVEPAAQELFIQFPLYGFLTAKTIRDELSSLMEVWILPLGQLFARFVM